MCNGVVTLTSRDGSKMFVGSGSHHTLARKHGVHAGYMVSSEAQLYKGPIQFRKDGRVKAGYFTVGYGAGKEAKRKINEFFKGVLASSDSLADFIEEYGLDWYSVRGILNADATDLLDLATEPFEKLAKVEKKEKKIKIIGLKAERTKLITDVVVDLNARLAKQFPDYKPGVAISDKITSLRKEMMGLTEFGFLTTPNVKNLIAEIEDRVGSIDSELKEIRLEGKTQDDSYLCRHFVARMVRTPGLRVKAWA